jgi:hypothetical protein
MWQPARLTSEVWPVIDRPVSKSTAWTAILSEYLAGRGFFDSVMNRCGKNTQIRGCSSVG